MRVLTFRHVPFEDLGRILPMLGAAGIENTYADLYEEPDAVVELGAHAAVILMGGPMSANDDLAYLRREVRLVEEAISTGKPVLGICLGAQLLAKAAGARVYRNRVKEIGWAPVYWTEAAREDGLFGGLDGPETVFHWHGETFDLPAGAELLAWSEGCRHQAFRLGSCYGLQFHLEVTPAMIADWVREEANQPDIAGLPGPIDAEHNAARLEELASRVFGRWLGMLCGAGAGPAGGGGSEGTSGPGTA